MIVNAYDYDTHGAPQSWAKVMAMRHALSKFPECKFVWYLDQDAYIMDPSKSLEEQVAGPRKLESLMIKDHPVIPPDSIIKTFAHLKGQDTHFVVSQDKEGLIHRSVIVRNGEWAKFFLETWLDPLYRSYNFQKAEGHGLVSSLRTKESDLVARRPHLGMDRIELISSTGTSCAVAPDRSIKTRFGTTEDTSGLLAARKGRSIQGR